MAIKPYIIGASVLTSALLIVLYLKKKGNTHFKRKAVRLAKKEYKSWGGEKETERIQDLQKYWRNIGWSDASWTSDGTAWSSAFISYIMKEAGAKDNFKYSSSHSTYIRDAIKNRKENNRNPFKAYLLNERKAKVGDLVCRARQSNVGYDTTSSYKSHCDIITKIKGNTAYAIGGNVSNSVSITEIPLVKGFIQQGNQRFTIIKTK
jgi:hypothetical protein